MSWKMSSNNGLKKRTKLLACFCQAIIPGHWNVPGTKLLAWNEVLACRWIDPKKQNRKFNYDIECPPISIKIHHPHCFHRALVGNVRPDGKIKCSDFCKWAICNPHTFHHWNCYENSTAKTVLNLANGLELKLLKIKSICLKSATQIGNQLLKIITQWKIPCFSSKKSKLTT